jgi:hypothetical protein
MMRSTIPKPSRSSAVRRIAVAASAERLPSFHRIAAQPSGEMTA